MAPEQVIQRLFDFCAALFRSIVVTRRAYRLLDNYGWTEEKDRFIIWGDGFDISEGELDNSFSTKNVHHLRRSVEILLSSLAGSLLRLLDEDQRESKLAVLKDIVQHVQPQAAELLSCATNTDDSVFWDGPKPTLEDLVDLNDSLYWLIPFLEEIQEESSVVETEGLKYVPSAVATAAQDSNGPDSINSTSNQELRDPAFEELHSREPDRGSILSIPNEQVARSLTTDFMGILGNTGPSQIGVDRRLENLALDTNELSLFDLEYDDQDSEKHSTNSVCSRRSLRSVHSIRSTHSARTSFHRRSLILSSENESYGTNSTVSDFSLATLSTDRVIQGQVYLLSDKDDWSIERAPTNECFFSFTGCNERPDVAHWVPHAKEHIRRQGIHQDPGPLECGICGVRVTEGTWSSVFIHAFIHLQPGGIVRRDSNLLGHLMGYGIITLRQLGALNIHEEGGILPPSTSIPGPRSLQDSTQPRYPNDTQAVVLHHGGSN